MPRVPVVGERQPRALVADDVAREIAEGARIVAVRTHGTYAAGDAVEFALSWTTSCELSARVLLGLREAGINP